MLHGKNAGEEDAVLCKTSTDLQKSNLQAPDRHIHISYPFNLNFTVLLKFAHCF